MEKSNNNLIFSLRGSADFETLEYLNNIQIIKGNNAINRLLVVTVHWVHSRKIGDTEYPIATANANNAESFISNERMNAASVPINAVIIENTKIMISIEVPVMIDASDKRIGTPLAYENGNNPKYDNMLALHSIEFNLVIVSAYA